MNVVLITGAAKRIGRVLAHIFAEQGFAVALHYHQSEKEARELAEALPTKSTLLQADLADLTLAHAEALFEKAADDLGTPINTLINNAAMFERDSAAAIDETLWQRHLHLNLRAPVFLAHGFARHQRDQGNIIMLVDQKVLRPTPHFFSYTISKMALWDATRLLAQALAPKIRVNAIAPGSILRDHHQTEEEFARSQKMGILERSATAEEIAAAALFFISQPAITGQILTLDGGKHITPLS